MDYWKVIVEAERLVKRLPITSRGLVVWTEVGVWNGREVNGFEICFEDRVDT